MRRMMALIGLCAAMSLMGKVKHTYTVRNNSDDLFKVWLKGVPEEHAREDLLASFELEPGSSKELQLPCVTEVIARTTIKRLKNTTEDPREEGRKNIVCDNSSSSDWSINLDTSVKTNNLGVKYGIVDIDVDEVDS